MKRGLIVGGGPVALVQLQAEIAAKPDLVLAADAGGQYLLELGIVPDGLVGDFDSLPEEHLKQLTAKNCKIYRFSPRKDQTDLQLTLKLAIELGVTELKILGGLGGRSDHTLANIGLLQYAWEAGVNASLADEKQELRVTGDRLTLRAKPGWAVSLIPLTPVVQGITTSGLAYSLQNEELVFTATRGVHNEFSAAEAIIELTAGRLLIVEFQE